MSRYGVVELKEGQRGKLIPRVRYDQVRLRRLVCADSAAGGVKARLRLHSRTREATDVDLIEYH